MTDIKDRLRWRADSVGDGFHSDLIYRDALRYIEKLEAALAHIYAWYPVSVSHPAQTIEDIREFARKALEGKDD